MMDEKAECVIGDVVCLCGEFVEREASIVGKAKALLDALYREDSTGLETSIDIALRGLQILAINPAYREEDDPLVSALKAMAEACGWGWPNP